MQIFHKFPPLLCPLTWLEDIASQTLHELSWPSWRRRLPHLSFESKSELKAKPTWSIWPCKSDTQIVDKYNISTWSVGEGGGGVI